MRSYQTARNLYGFLGFLAWCVIVVGGIVAFLAGGAISTGGFGNEPSPAQFFIAIIPGGLVALAGIYGLALVQNGRTSVDVAEYSQQALEVSRQQLDISKQLLTQGATLAASYAALKPAKPLPMQENSKPEEPAGGASYANQPSSDSTPQTATEQPVAAQAIEAPKPTAVAKEEQVLLEPARLDIVYRDGQFAIGEKAFQTKDAALEHLSELKANPAR